MAEEFKRYWPQYDEQVSDADSFVDLCRINPYELKIQVLNCQGEYVRWGKTFSIAAQISIESADSEGRKISSFGIAVFEIDRDGLITSITEYLAPTLKSPQWRKGLTEPSNAYRQDFKLDL